jgi:hypothetical protein
VNGWIRIRIQQGWKNPGFFLNPAQWIVLGFLGFFGVFMGFLGLMGFLGFLPDERVFRVFSVSEILLGASRL